MLKSRLIFPIIKTSVRSILREKLRSENFQTLKSKKVFAFYLFSDVNYFLLVSMDMSKALTQDNINL